MNKHFDDSLYYLARAAEHAKLGVSEAIDPYARRLREVVGREPEPEPEPDRLEAVREELAELERKAEGQAREAIGDARRRLAAYRSDEVAAER